MPHTLPLNLALNTNLNIPLNLAEGPLGIIRAQGTDAVKFLQGQLTQDVALLGLSEARLAAWCSAKGRMLASFVVFKITHEDILLLCSTSVLPATLKRLQMFVMRAQCKLTDATAEFAVRGLAGQQALLGDPTNASTNTPTDAPEIATNLVATRAIPIWQITRNGDEIRLQLPFGLHLGQPVPRALQVRPGAPLANVSSDLSGLPAQGLPDAAPSDAAVWQYLEASTGIAPITAAISDAFVPQMLNYESVGGVNFKKGCYPGQEVVARSQFRGTLKRRAFVASSTAQLAAGQELFDSRDTEQPCGTIAYAAPLGAGAAGQCLAIVSMQISAADSPRLSAGSAEGPALWLQALPYALLDDI